MARRNATAVSSSVTRRAGGTDAGFRPHLLRQEAGAVDLARSLLSRIENNQMPTKPMVIENSAGLVYGNSAEPFGLPSVASHTDGETTVSTTERDQAQEAADDRAARGAVLPQHAHEQHREVGRCGDGEGQADTMKAMFCFSKAMPSTTAMMPRHTVVIFDTRSSEALSAVPFLTTVA